MMRVADYIADYVSRQGVKEIFLVSGGGMMFLTDGIATHPKLTAICNHHEQASAMAAVAYAKYNNNLGVAYLTTGCGGTNAVTGVLNAWQDNIPCLFISGNVKKHNTTRNSGLKLRQFGVQELDIVSVVEPITKYATMVNEPEEIAYELDKAVYLAKSGRPGPVWLDIPQDVQSAMIDETKLKRFEPEEKEAKKPSEEQLKNLEKLLSEAKRPIVLAGQGVRLSNSNSEFKKLVEKFNLPVVVSTLGVGLLPTQHPLFIGRLGAQGDRPGNFAVQNADLVLTLGCHVSVSTVGYEYSKFAREAKVVVVDIDPVEHQKKGEKVDVFIEADLKQFFLQFKYSGKKVDADWVKKCQQWKKQWPTHLPEYHIPSGKVNLFNFVDKLSGLMKPDSVVVSDAGSAFYVTTKAIQLKEKQRYVTSGGQAEMGFTVPAVIGVSCARGHKETIGITGDGSFQMNIQELQTIKHNKLPVKIFVWNNNGYLSIRNTQTKFFDKRLIGTDKTSGVSFPELKKIAAAYGIKYFLIKNNREIEGVIKKVLKEKGPVICEVICLEDQEIIPAVSSYKREDGKMVSRPMEDMYPFLDREEFKKHMIIKPLED